jgi:hypothetical protein
MPTYFLTVYKLLAWARKDIDIEEAFFGLEMILIMSKVNIVFIDPSYFLKQTHSCNYKAGIQSSFLLGFNTVKSF